MYDTKRILESAKKDFEKTWASTQKMIPRKGRNIPLKKSKQQPHAVNELREGIRRLLLSLGFAEVINTPFIDEQEVIKQYGPESPVILDRIYYLAGLQRPDIGISASKLNQIKKIVPKFDRIDELKKTFRDYKEAIIEGDDLVEEMTKRINIQPEQATAILSLFNEFRQLTPKPSKNTLRSHMTANWFGVLKALQDRKRMPLMLFSIDRVFRKEQKIDESHLRSYHSVSVVILNKNLSLEDAHHVSEKIMKGIGFKNLTFVTKKAPSKYYVPGFEEEIYGELKGRRVEIGNSGFYNPISLARYGIKYPVFNVGFGLERMAMILNKSEDVRELVFPQFYGDYELSDKEMAGMVSLNEKPVTPLGKEIQNAIIETGIKHANAPSPCEFLAWKGDINGRNAKVFVFENESNTKLLGPAALNKVFVQDGNIIAYKQVKGVSTGVSLLEAVAGMASARFENADKNETIQVKMIKEPSDVNIKIDPVARYHTTSNHKSIIIKGPVFLGLKIVFD